MACVSGGAQAAACQSGAKAAADLWNQYGDVVKQIGCVATTVGTAVASAGTTLPASVAVYQGCLQSANAADKATHRMIRFWNEANKNGWGTIGPRRLAMGTQFEGIIRGPATRMFMTESPLTNARLRLDLTKLRFRGRTEVTVCTYLPDNDAGTQIDHFSIDNGLGNKGHVYTRRYDDVRGRLLSVFLNGKSVAKSMKYRLVARPIAESKAASPSPVQQTVVISGRKGGHSDYTLRATGPIEKVDGRLNGKRVSVGSGDRVQGGRVDGTVWGQADGYRIHGHVASLEFANPEAVQVDIRTAGGSTGH